MQIVTAGGGPHCAVTWRGWIVGDGELLSGSLLGWYFVPPATNRGSAFAGHLVLVWNADGHTYAYGFHVLETFAVARALDLELARNLVTVRPRSAR